MATLDSCRALKLESPGVEGGTQLDMGPTEVNPLQDAMTAAGLFVNGPTVTTADKLVLIDRINGNLRLTDTVTSHTLSELVSSAAGEVGSHNALLDVIHFVADGPGDFWPSGSTSMETYAGPLLTARTWYTDSTLAKKIVSWSWSYTGPLVQNLKMVLYAADGSTAVKSVTDAYTYNGPLLASRTRTFGIS